MDGEFLLVSLLEYPHTVLHVSTSCGSEVLSSSVLECRVYAKHLIGSDFIGGAKEEIKLLLTKGATGGVYIRLFNPFR